LVKRRKKGEERTICWGKEAFAKRGLSREKGNGWLSKTSRKTKNQSLKDGGGSKRRLKEKWTYWGAAEKRVLKEETINRQRQRGEKQEKVERRRGVGKCCQ